MTYRTLAIVAALLLVAGCSSHDGGGSGSPHVASSNDLNTYLLTQDAFPAGSKYSRSTFDNQDYRKTMAANLRISTYTPPQCRAPKEEQVRVDSTMHRVGGEAAYENRQYEEYVSKGGESADLLRRLYLGECANARVDRHLPTNGVTDSFTNHAVELPAPSGLHVDDVVMFAQTTVEDDHSGPTRTEKSVYATAYTHRLMVGLNMSYDPKTQPNMDEFDRLLKAAVDKVNNPT